MNRNLIVGLVIGLLVLGGGAVFLLGGNEDEPKTEEQTTTANTATQTEMTDNQETVEPVASVANQSYLEYDEDTFAENADRKRLLFFHADWCPTCRAFEDYIKDQDLPDDLVILEVDYDSSPDLKRQYDIFAQSFLVYVDAGGNLVDSWHTSEAPTLDDVITRTN